MDVSVLPNNNDPQKFLQLEVRTLPAARGLFQLGAVMSSQRTWQNRLYLQRESQSESDGRPGLFLQDRPVLVDRYLEKHITPITLKSNIKRNPLFQDTKTSDHWDNEMTKPSWTVKDYDTQIISGHLADHLKEDEKTPKDLDFWLGDLYTPGFDSLLMRQIAEEKRKRFCKVFSSVIVSVCAVLLIVVPTVLLLKTN